MIEIVTTVFDSPDEGDKFRRLRNVFVGSVAENMPDAKLTVLELAPSSLDSSLHQHLVNNRHKLAAELDHVGKIQHPTILMDIDMAVLRPLNSAFNDQFDVGITVRPEHPKLPFNGGVVFLRPTSGAQKWLDDMRKADELLYNDRNLFEPYRKLFGGINQAAMGYVLERHRTQRIRYKEFDSAIWNACNEHWKHLSSKTRVLHIKGPLRKMFFGDIKYKNYYQRIIDIANQYEIKGAQIEP